MKLLGSSLFLLSCAVPSVVQANPNGAGACNLGALSVGHGAPATTLDALTVSVTIAGVSAPLTVGGPATTLTVGTPVQVTVTSDSAWRGILVRLQGGTIDIPDGTLYKEGPCAAGVSTEGAASPYCGVSYSGGKLIDSRFGSAVFMHFYVPHEIYGFLL